MFLSYFETIFHNFLKRHTIYEFVVVFILLIGCKLMFKKYNNYLLLFLSII